MTAELRFPTGFLWGASTAAYQIEGAADADGRTPSIWDTFARTPGAIIGGDTGDVACDHYHRFRTDVALMAELGLRAYRFSVSWSRVQPGGSGAVNQAGLDFYRRLVDELLDHNIEPWLTLYHWDLPQELEDEGGWPQRETAYRFAEYAAIMADAIGDRVRMWSTLNEPFCASLLGYSSGEHAPGRSEPKAAVAAAHHLLLAHGLGMAAIRSAAPDSTVGLTLNFATIVPRDADDPADVNAARRIDGLQNRLFIDPVLAGRFAEDVMADLEPLGLGAQILPGDMELISAPIDNLGVNYYTTNTVSAHANDQQPASDVVTPNPPGSIWVGAEDISFHTAGFPVTEQGWEINPAGLADVLLRIGRSYPQAPPLYVTENGAAYDVPVVAGSVNDTDRIAYIAGHLQAVRQAIADGIDVRGYFAWSLLDNFEWAWGYGQRFGLVHVDFATQRRIPKASAHWYKQVIEANGALDEIVAGAITC